jgi:hypothetical protein
MCERLDGQGGIMTRHIGFFAVTLGLLMAHGACKEQTSGNVTSTSNVGGKVNPEGTIDPNEAKYLPGNAKPVDNGGQVQQTQENACDNPVNEHISIGGYEAWIEKTPLGRMNVSIKQIGTTTFLGGGCAIFDGAAPTDMDAETGCNGTGVYFHGGMVRGGRTVWGTLVIDRASGGKHVNVHLDGGGRVRIGTLRDSAVGANTTIDFNSGACLVRYRYKTRDGLFFSGGQGYIVMP